MTVWPRLIFLLPVGALLAAGSAPAGAQDWFGDPFATAEALREQGGASQAARLVLRYATSGDDRSGQPAGDLVIWVASAWAHVERGSRRTLYDFRLRRVLELRDDGTFVSRSMLSDVTFRVGERQNRSALTEVLRGKGATGPMDACDAETELGLAIPGSKEPAAVEIKQSGMTMTLECNGRVIGVLETGFGEKAPPALWPTLAREMTMHPALQTRLAEGGAAPRRLEASFRRASQRKALSWRLVSAEDPMTLPYPLTANLVNATAASINEAAAPGLGDLATEAVAGRALGGPPTLAGRDAEVARLEKQKGAAAAALATWPALNMFPVQLAQWCQSGAKSAMCDSLRTLGSTAAKDAAVQALLDITKAEQSHRPSDAIAAMLAARASHNGDHPVLGASFALALQGGGVEMHKQAEAAGVPTDPKALHVRALQAYPYNPAYWTDLGDYFARSYDLATAYALYDVAFSLPMRDAQRGNLALSGKRELAARLARDFPAFFLDAGRQQ
ncbi:MAG: hypothetical protein J2P50_18765 [Hyphomicrobiaceae bacterium]|nr:hypothetical protein [Hyphomicrobiaceae bacterium]